MKACGPQAPIRSPMVDILYPVQDPGSAEEPHRDLACASPEAIRSCSAYALYASLYLASASLLTLIISPPP